MNRQDHTEAKDALDAYLRAKTPTSMLTLRLVCAIGQLLANDQQSKVDVAIGKVPPITRVPQNLTIDRRLASLRA